MSYIIANNNPIHSLILQESLGADNFIFISDKNELSYKQLLDIKPDYIFFPHWSYIIPEEIFRNFNCIVFHMTDLPYGRGGSPLQNLITRGYTETKISALKVVKNLDAGPIYLKKSLSLYGSAEEIFLRAGRYIVDMIKEIINKNPDPIEQTGQPTVFKRRKPEMSNIEDLSNIEEIYDYIRMLDAEGYPKAFIETKHFRIEFSRASLKANEIIIADVRISKK